MSGGDRTADEPACLLYGGHEEGFSIHGTSDFRPQEGDMNWRRLGVTWRVPKLPGSEARTSICADNRVLLFLHKSRQSPM